MSGLRKWQQAERVGGHPAVDFVNSVHHWDSDPPPDYFDDFDDFLAWSEELGLLDSDACRHFRGRPADEKSDAFHRLLALRRALHDSFASIAQNRPPPDPALQELDEMLRRSIAWRRYRADKDGIRACWSCADAPAYAALGPVAWQAADLLEHGSIDRLKKCPGEHCGWIFIDGSKNRSRTWCSMKTCGNTAKVKRFRSKSRGTGE